MESITYCQQIVVYITNYIQDVYILRTTNFESYFTVTGGSVLMHMLRNAQVIIKSHQYTLAVAKRKFSFVGFKTSYAISGPISIKIAI